MRTFGIVVLLMTMICPLSAKASQTGEYPRLRIVNKGTADGLLYYGDAPALAFGPSHQRTLSHLGHESSMDIDEWVQWAAEFKMSNLRSYPPVRITSDGSHKLFLQSGSTSRKYDLTQFNPEYFRELRRACELLRDNGIIVHLQLWQAVAWKKGWDVLYYNPVNNVNPDISKNAGPGEFTTMKNPALLKHQKEYVRQILEATADVGNVFYDIMNEIGNGVAANKSWVEEIIDTVRQWERDNGCDVLLTLNDEGGMRMGEYSLSNPRLDLIVKDLGRYDEHVQARQKYRKPTIGVRNIDYDATTGQRTYFFSDRDLDGTSSSSLQSRGRRVWWRMFMALVQSNGGYSDVSHEQRKRDLQAEHAVLHFKEFIGSIRDYAALRISPGAIAASPGASAYCLQSKREVVVYCEAPGGKAGIDYTAGLLKLKELAISDGAYTAMVFEPATGVSWEEAVSVKQGRMEMELPKFTDDIAVLITGQPEGGTKDPKGVPGDGDDETGEPSHGTGGESTGPVAGQSGGGGGGCTMSPDGSAGVELLLLAAVLPFLLLRGRRI